MTPKEIQEKAKRELGEWLAANIKKSVAEEYKFFRLKVLRAHDAFVLARKIVEGALNRFAEDNFYAGLPH